MCLCACVLRGSGEVQVGRGCPRTGRKSKNVQWKLAGWKDGKRLGDCRLDGRFSTVTEIRELGNGFARCVRRSAGSAELDP